MFDRLDVKEKPVNKAEEPGEMYSKNTVKVYQSALNKLADSLNITTVDALLDKQNQKKIVKHINDMTGNYYKKRVMYSAIFYALGYRPKKDIMILFKGFEKWKKPDPQSTS